MLKTLMSILVYGLTFQAQAGEMGTYISEYGEELRYRYFQARSKDHENKLFIYVSGDGDTCINQSNPFDQRLKDWHEKTGEMYSESGNWVFAEVLSHKYCDRPERLDGLGFSYRYQELINLINTLEVNYPKINEIYLMAFSAGPWVAIEVANRMKKNKKIKGLMIGGFSHTKLENTLAGFFLKHGDLRTGDTTFERKIEIATDIHIAFSEAQKGCSTAKKTLYMKFPFESSDPTESLAAKRTDNHYCETNIDSSIGLKNLSKNLKILILQGENDRIHTAEAAYQTFNLLLSAGKHDVTLSVMPGIGHSFGYSYPEISKVISKWSK